MSSARRDPQGASRRRWLRSPVVAATACWLIALSACGGRSNFGLAHDANDAGVDLFTRADPTVTTDPAPTDLSTTTDLGATPDRAGLDRTTEDRPTTPDRPAIDQGTDAEAGCLSPADCPAPQNPCRLATCNLGLCGTLNVIRGVLLMRDLPPDCQALVCDGMGNVMKAPDPDNVPLDPNPCVQGACDSAGMPHSLPLGPGTPCMSATGGHLCDGAGQCVDCLRDADCPFGGACAPNHHCTSSSCMNGLQDNDETDVDCGGSCLPCAPDRSCLLDSDCASQLCEPVIHVCLLQSCGDGVQNGNESAVDCGGECEPCDLGQQCRADQDCSSQACDSVSMTCVADYCSDHHQNHGESDIDCGGYFTAQCPPCQLGQKCQFPDECVTQTCTLHTCDVFHCANGKQDGNETDIDCGGGGMCPQCQLGQKCQISSDCLSGACDALTQICVADHCFDHATDGDETDTDCGGPTCGARCAFTRLCQQDSDCLPGLTCGGSPPICD